VPLQGSLLRSSNNVVLRPERNCVYNTIWPITTKTCNDLVLHKNVRTVNSFIDSGYFCSASSSLQVNYYSEAFLTQHGYCARVSRRSATGNCEWRTCPRSHVVAL